jgi:uncharacterized protein (TIRG00374 family)
MKALKKIWNVSWRLALCLLLLVWIFHVIFLKEAQPVAAQNGINWEQLPKLEQWKLAWQLGPRELWQTLTSVHRSWLALSVLLVGSTIFLGVIRWRMVLQAQGLHLSLSRASEISFVAHFFNSFLLGSTGGDLMKAFYAARETHHKKTEAVTTVFVDRLLGLWSMLAFAAFMMLPNWKLLFTHEKLAAAALLILAMLAACSVFLRLAFWSGISKRWPRARELFRKLPKGEVLERSLDACRQFGPQRAFIFKSLIISIALNTVCVLQIMALARGLELRIPDVALFVIVPVIICISALPITPSGLGVREGLFVVMLSVPEIGVEQKAALSLSLLAYAGGLFWSVAGGLVYAFLRERQHLAEITHAEPAEERA